MKEILDMKPEVHIFLFCKKVTSDLSKNFF